jgi:GTP-binding protein EngB required for normal cell division
MESSTSTIHKLPFRQSVLVIGLAGKGKSSILNTLISGNHNGKDFVAAKSKNPVTREVSHKDIKIFGTDSPVFTFFDVPGMLGGEQPFTEWVDDIIKNVKHSKVSLVFIVMSKEDRMDVPTQATWAAVKDLLQGIAPKSIVLTLTRCEDGLDEEEQAEAKSIVEGYYGKGFLQPKIL